MKDENRVFFGVMTAFVGMCVFVMLNGCQSVRERIDAGDTGVRVAVQYATLKYIADDVDRADRVIRVAEDLRVFAEDESATIRLLSDALHELVPWNDLDAADNMLLTALLGELEAELRARMGAGVLSEDDRVRVVRVIDWVQEAARLSAGAGIYGDGMDPSTGSGQVGPFDGLRAGG